MFEPDVEDMLPDEFVAAPDPEVVIEELDPFVEVAEDIEPAVPDEDAVTDAVTVAGYRILLIPYSPYAAISPSNSV